MCRRAWVMYLEARLVGQRFEGKQSQVCENGGKCWNISSFTKVFLAIDTEIPNLTTAAMVLWLPNQHRKVENVFGKSHLFSQLLIH